MAKEKLQAEVLKVKNQEVVLQLKVLKVVKCLYIEDYQKEVLIQLKKNEKYAIINLSKIQSLIDKKIISPTTKIDLNFLKSKKIIKKNVTKFKILGTGEIKNKIKFRYKFLSKSAKDKLSKSGSFYI